MNVPNLIQPDYQAFIAELKERIQTAQIKAALSVNRELVLLYWQIGKAILDKQQAAGWGTKIIDTLSADLTHAFPSMKGFSPRNLGYMKKFAEAYPDLSILQQAAAKLPWTHNCLILDKVKDPETRLWYIEQTLAHGWSRNVLVHQIESNQYHRQVLADKTHNFVATLPVLQSDLAHQLLKDPYSFDFLTLGAEAQERDIETALIAHITQFLLELGKGFAFIGRQYHLDVGGSDYYLDLLFYHTRLKCHVVIELKAGAFKPKYAGKLNFYLSAVDDLIKDAADNPTIGIILCKEKDRVTAEYALRNLSSPISVNEYQLSVAIPEALQTSLPTIEALEREVEAVTLLHENEGERP
jgi:predicted nuclease of restriction endonuclease-like (RecB) superfamily